MIYYISSLQNMGRNLRFWTLEICLPYHESPWRTLGTPDATLATFWKRTFGTSSNELDDHVRTIFSSEALAWLEGGGCRCWPVDDGDGQFHQILYTVVEFVSQVVYIFRTFCPGSRPKVGCLFGMRTSDSDSDYQAFNQTMIFNAICLEIAVWKHAFWRGSEGGLDGVWTR